MGPKTRSATAPDTIFAGWPLLLVTGAIPADFPAFPAPSAPLDGTIVHADHEYSAIARIRMTMFALVVAMDDLPGDAQALIVRHAALMAVPVLIASRATPPTAADLVRQAAAPTVAARPDPLARLAPMFGRAGVVDLFARFRDRLAAVLAAADPLAIGEGATRPALAHRLAGMAGMLDLPDLADAWAAVETGGDAHWPAARIESRIALAQLDLMLR